METIKTISTRLCILRPGQPPEEMTVELVPKPGLDRLKEILWPIFNAHFEHVAVLSDFNSDAAYRRTDMFVDENGHSKGLPRNNEATVIYRRNTTLQQPGTDPELMPPIVGPAVLFDRRVWF